MIAVNGGEMSANTVALVAVCVYTPIYALLVGSVPRKSGIGFVSRLRVYYSTTDWSFWLEWMQAIFSIGTVILYVATSYYSAPSEHLSLAINLEVFFGIFYAFNFSFELLLSKNRWAYVMSLLGAVDIVTTVPIFIILATGDLDNSPTGFVRFYRVVMLSRVFKPFRLLRAVETLSPGKDAVVEQTVRVIAYFISTLFLASGLVQVLSDGRVDEWGDVSFMDTKPMAFHDALYFIIVTFSTVGYGDISPPDTQSRLAIVLLVGFFFFMIPRELNTLNQLLDLSSKYTGQFPKKLTGGHTIVGCDVATCGLVAAFLDEFFHADHGYNVTHLVLLVPHEPTVEWKRLILRFSANDRVTYLKGDLRSTADLHRVHANTASSCFILSNRHGNLKEEDKRGFMRAISVQGFNPHINIFVEALTVGMRQRLIKVHTNACYNIAAILRSVVMSPMSLAAPPVALSKHIGPTTAFLSTPTAGGSGLARYMGWCGTGNRAAITRITRSLSRKRCRPFPTLASQDDGLAGPEDPSIPPEDTVTPLTRFGRVGEGSLRQDGSGVPAGGGSSDGDGQQNIAVNGKNTGGGWTRSTGIGGTKGRDASPRNTGTLAGGDTSADGVAPVVSGGDSGTSQPIAAGGGSVRGAVDRARARAVDGEDVSSGVAGEDVTPSSASFGREAWAGSVSPPADDSEAVGGASGGRVGGAAFDAASSPAWGKQNAGRRDSAAADGPARRDSDGGRLKLKFGVDVDLKVPLFIEALVRGPWDPNGDVWRRQVDMAVQVIRRSGGVVFMEQLAPILNPREGPSRWDREKVTVGSSTPTDETIVLRLLSELGGIPEVTRDGDILYVFPGVVGGSGARKGVAEADEAFSAGLEGSSARPEVLQFEEVPRLLDSLPKIPDEGPKAVAAFFERTALSGFALFLATCLFLGQLIFGAWPLWLAFGPTYLGWVALDDSLRRSRNTSAKARDRMRREWAEACRGDGDAVWRKRAAARLRARVLAEDGI